MKSVVIGLYVTEWISKFVELRRSGESLDCSTRLCRALQHWPLRGNKMDCFWMKKSAHSVLPVRGTAAGLRGWGGGFECQSGPGADITLLHSLYVLIVSRSSSERQREGKICSVVSPHPPAEKLPQTCRWDTRNKASKTDRAGDGQEEVSQSRA